MDHPKRKMKTPSQLEILERVYAEDKYPSEIVRSELSSQLNLTDRQVKMWFCHRRLKDRKINNEESVKKQRILELPPQHPGLSLDLQMRGIPQQQMPQPHHFLDVMHPDDPSFHMRQLPNADAPRRMGLPHNVSPLDCRLSVNAEVAAVRLVEEQLGEPLREDGPVLGYEFDPLPPGAFDTPIEHRNQWRGPPDGLHSDSKLHLARHDSSSKLSKALASEFSPSPTTSSSKRKATAFLTNAPIPAVSSRVPQEHQFIPEHPTGTHLYERKPDIYERKPDIPSRISPLPAFLPPAEPFGNGAPTLGLGFPPGALGDFRAFPPPEVQLLPPVRPPMSEKAIAGSERLIMLHEQEQARLERKRKAEEARLAKELEAQEKRMRKEVERQEALRRKKEEQERKELERLNKERQKELERLMRERAREEERIQKQHRKEFERMEKMMQKEHQRVEKLRQKEEMRREREASKMRAAYERATAKKLAKLSTGLMDDEQLELMQMGAFAQGLVSTGFDPSEVELSKFPPASVRMKPPVAVPPWIDSDHNVANLFMVWRMLTNFADVIGLWPFTIDEFVQALHDYDSRLLGEIHIALVKTLVKDVRDASNASSLGNNQALSVACGGHPELVEAAYAWGFDIQEWGQHVNALTWPEILRQFALASGYGPRWKRRTTEVDLTTTITEGKNAEEAVANIRSGAAAENAVTQMRGKCSTRVKKQQQPQKLILTPGTVKYAAFQVLSIEGSKGLTVLEVVDRIQKAGLRDLTTSKTPEASISAVLSRDTKLFERVAPSTYCVRAMYRKNLEAAESVLQAALEKIDLYETEVLEEDVEEAEEPEREDEDEADEQELDELAENNNNINCTRTPSPSSSGKVILRLKVKPSARRASECIEMNLDNAGVGDGINDGMEIDESQVGEVWVQGLMEGEYTDLSVEERLSGLVALVEAVNQGNTIRSAIEERYEAASALKRQLWEEVQLDKRRIKEEAAKAEEEEKTDNGSQDHVEDGNVSSEKRLDSQKSRAEMKADIRQRADKLYVIRSLPLGLDRRFNRYWQFVTCGNDPGCGRIYCESHADGHWEVMDTEEALNSLMNALDTRGIREADLFVSLKELEPSLRQSMAARSKLNLDLCDGSPSSGVVGSGKESLELVHGSITIENSNSGAIRRYKDMERWLWKYSSYVKATQMGVKRDNPDGDNIVECETCHDMHWQCENHCKCCHLTGFEEDFTQHVDDCGRGMVTKEIQGKLPPRIQLLKKLLFLVEMHIPREAFKEIWPDSYRKAWCNRLKAASTAAEILQVFVDVDSAIEQGWMSSTYETIDQVGSLIGNQKRNIPAWIPQTSAAVALRLMLFDAAIAYTNEQKEQFMFKQQKARVKQKLVEEKIPEVYTGGGEEVKAEAYGVNKGEGESEDSLNWDAQDSFEEPEHPQNCDGQLSEEEEEEEEQLSSDTDDNKNKDSHVVSGEGANVTDDED